MRVFGEGLLTVVCDAGVVYVTGLLATETEAPGRVIRVRGRHRGPIREAGLLHAKVAG